MPMMRRSSSSIKDLIFLLLVFATTYYMKICYCTVEETGTCPEMEKQALVSFKQSLEADPEGILSSWNDDEVDCCLWKGVVCNNLTGHVHELRLPGRYYDALADERHGLRGKINSSLLNLKYLSHLDLSFNDFRETIPSFIGSFANMEYLNLCQAGFDGAVPTTIGNLSNLRALNLQSDYYTDFGDRSRRIYSDNLDWLSGLSKLEHLNMNYVNLSSVSNWVHAINTLPHLSQLHLQLCELEWSTSVDFFNNISSLVTLDLSYNDLDGAVVLLRRLFQLASLRFLYLGLVFSGGPIPSIGNTTNLEYIDLSGNSFNSTIPDWLYSCNTLKVVNLAANSLVGAISNDISNLSSLTVLDLSFNHFKGNVPPAVLKSGNIRSLNLANNQLQGDLSDLSGNMSECFLGALETLRLDSNQFSGHISKRFGNFKNLQTLDLSHNSLSGFIPYSVLGELSSLGTLHLSYNKFVGNLPEHFGKLSKSLKDFDVSYNLLQGVVTERHLIDMKNLSRLIASGNQLSFNLSPNWIPPFQLLVLNLASTNLSGPFPLWLETQRKIESLDLSNSGIHGVVPNWVWNIANLNLSHNNLHGNIPNITRLADDFSFRGIYLSSNRFSGPLPHIASDVIVLDISNNFISGGIANVICANNATESYRLEFVLLNGNHLSGQLPDCWMRLGNLAVLSLRDNNLYGSIPSSIGLLKKLFILNLGNNRISGNIPPSILNSIALANIDLSGNCLDGNLPEWTKANSHGNLAIISLGSNRLSGRIKSDICLLSSLKILDLSNNSLYGAIPRCFGNFTGMVHDDDQIRYRYGPSAILGDLNSVFTDSATITTKGQQLTYDTTLGLFAGIDLSNNNLSGNIPLELTRLLNLKLLNLSRNHLSGSIPSNIGDMKQLESLDLSLNSLTGEIPNSFTVMSSLSSLNLSYNRLTGRIPESTQLQTMNASSFIGNKLCGPPLTVRRCGVDDDNNKNNNDIVSHTSVDVDWFTVLLSLGFTIGLSTFLVVLFFGNSLREAYFEKLDHILGKMIYNFT